MKIRFDISIKFFEGGISMGQDVTKKFWCRGVTRPVQAVIVDPLGSSDGNPIVEFTFRDEDHAWEWASNELEVEPEEFERQLQQSVVEA